MRRSVWSSLLLVVLTVAPLSAQNTPNRKGFWLGFGLGAGVNLAQGMDEKSLWGGSGYLRLGGTPKANLLLGGEAIGWTVDYKGVNLSRGNVHFVTVWYPNVTSGFYLKGGIGGASISRRTESGNSETTTTKGGFGLGLGTGYEVKIGRNIYLVPSADLLLQFFEKDTDPVLGDIPGHNSLLLFNLGLTWH